MIIALIVSVCFIFFLALVPIYYVFKKIEKSKIIINRTKTPPFYWIGFITCIVLIVIVFMTNNDFLILAISPLVAFTILFFTLFSILRHESEVENGPLKRGIQTGKGGGGMHGSAGVWLLHVIYLIIKRITIKSEDSNENKVLYDKNLKP